MTFPLLKFFLVEFYVLIRLTVEAVMSILDGFGLRAEAYAGRLISRKEAAIDALG